MPAVAAAALERKELLPFRGPGECRCMKWDWYCSCGRKTEMRLGAGPLATPCKICHGCLQHQEHGCNRATAHIGRWLAYL